jgi:small subunit ribosomal protein S4
MGDPKRHRKKYHGPSHPWQRSRLEEESGLKREYGLKNKKEIWKAKSQLKHFADIAKKIARLNDDYSKKKATEVVNKLKKYGLLEQNQGINDILSLSAKDFLERRLQTVIYRNKLAKSIKQARQFIVHGHISIGNKKISVPSYLVKLDEERDIGFATNSPIAATNHPERTGNELKEEPETKTGEGEKKELSKATEKPKKAEKETKEEKDSDENQESKEEVNADSSSNKPNNNEDKENQE